MIQFGSKTGKQAKPKNKVGIDIGSSYIKMLEVSVLQDKATLLSFGEKKLMGRTRDAISDTIKELAAEKEIVSRDAAISISGPSVIVRFISMPKMAQEELKSAIRFEAEKFIPFNINDCIIDFQVIKRDDKEAKLTVLFVAAKKDHVEERVKIVEASGFAVTIVDVDSFALANAFFRSFIGADQEKSFALLNMGTSFTNLSVVKGGAVHLVRDISIGMKDLDGTIAKSLGIDIKEAEAVRFDPKDRIDAIAACAKGVFSSLVDEMRLPFSYYENQSGRGIDEIYVSGGGAAIAGLEDMFHDAFGSKPIFWDPFQWFAAASPKIDKEKMNSSFAIASGLVSR